MRSAIGWGKPAETLAKKLLRIALASDHDQVIMTSAFEQRARTNKARRAILSEPYAEIAGVPERHGSRKLVRAFY